MIFTLVCCILFFAKVIKFMTLAKPIFAAMAQSVEHVLGKDEVSGPNPDSSSKSRYPELSDIGFIYKISEEIVWRSGK